MLEQLLNTRHWYLEEAFLDQLLPVALQRIELGHDLEIFKRPEPVRSLNSNIILADSDRFSFRTLMNDKGERVALIPLYGTMSKYGGLCSYGTAELAEMLNDANRNQDKIHAAIIDMDTPGGSGDSIEVLDRSIDTSEIPVMGWVDREACSAGQWIASAIARKGKVMVDSFTNSHMGSIGAYTIHQNIMAKLQANGIKVEIIRAPQSTDKTRFNNIEEITQDLRDHLRAELYEAVELFKNSVISNYGDSLNTEADKLWTGGTFNGKKCLEIGLAHEQGDLSTAFEMAMDMAKTKRKNSFNFSSNTNMKFLKNLGLSLGIIKELSDENLEALSTVEERLSTAEAEVTRLTEANGTLTTEVEGLTTSLEEANETIQTHESTIETQTARITELEEAAGGTPTTVVTQGDPVVTSEAQAIIDGLPHNKALDTNPMFNQPPKPKE